MSRITFIVPGDICPWARAGKHGKVQFTPAKQRNYMQVIRGGAHDAMDGRPPMEGPVSLKIVAVYPWPKTTTKKRRGDAAGAWKYTKPDSDNIAKIIKDSMNNIVFVDDAQCACVAIWKCFGSRPGLTVSVESLAETPAPVF